MRKETSREWGEFTKSAMDLVGLTQTELARILSKKLNRSITQGALQARLNGDRSQPPDESELQAWADALKLDGFHRQKFIRLALFSRTPLQIRKELLAAEDRIAANEKRIASLEKQDLDLRRQVVDLQRQLGEVTAQATELLGRVGDRDG